MEPRCVWGRNSEGSGGFRWVFGSNFHFWCGLCKVGICVGGHLRMIVRSGSELNLVGFCWDVIFLGSSGSGLFLCVCVRRVETLAV